ncbi:hypothetical protein ACXYMX_01165 [Sporosarcina sp. CAU 1771]
MKNVYKKYKDGVVAANEIDLKFTSDEFGHVDGTDGSGKSVVNILSITVKILDK